MSQVPFICPQCGGSQFRVTSQPKSLDDMIGALCADCGTPLTEDEIKKQAREIAEDAAKKGFKNLEF